MESATSWGAGILAGIAEHAENHDWLCWWEPHGRFEDLDLPADLPVDGVIARVTHRRLADRLESRGAPTVNTSWMQFEGYRGARCTSDEVAAGRMAAEHFLEKGHRHFAYCGASERHGHPDRLGTAFVSALQASNATCEVFSGLSSQTEGAGANGSTPPLIDTTATRRALAEWLLGLPKPCALLAFHCPLGRRVTEVCREVDLDVPNDISVLAGEYDAMSVRLSRPPLSCLDLVPREVGRRASIMLEKLMRGERLASTTELVSPAGIYEKRSSDAFAVEDDAIREAAVFIRDHASRGIHVADVLRAVVISRRTLEQGFRHYFGRTPADEIRRVRLYAAAELLRDTRLPVAEIATRVGFESSAVFTRAFRRRFDATPTAYRKAFLHRPASAAP